MTRSQIQGRRSPILQTLAQYHSKDRTHDNPHDLTKQIIPRTPLLSDNVTREETIDIYPATAGVPIPLKPTGKLLREEDIAQLRTTIPPYTIDGLGFGVWVP